MMDRKFMDNAERDRLCNLLAEKREELIMRVPGSWMHKHVLAEIVEIRSWLCIKQFKDSRPSVRFLVKRLS